MRARFSVISLSSASIYAGNICIVHAHGYCHLSTAVSDLVLLCSWLQYEIVGQPGSRRDFRLKC